MMKDFCTGLLRGIHDNPERAIRDIVTYLEWRQQTRVKGDDTFGVVFVTTRYCNLMCRHCAIDAITCQKGLTTSEYDLTTQEFVNILCRLHEYITESSQNIFLMFGGGEPTLREDFPLLLKEAATLFGKESVGFCTNGTYLSQDKIIALADLVGLVEISLDGFEDYHNLWRPPTSHVDNPYISTMSVIKQLIRHYPDKLEVASVLTASNKDMLPNFARDMRSRGVQNYSVHRPIAIGRMFHNRSHIPDIPEFLTFFANMAEVALEDNTFSLHLHYSLESIYSALLLGKDLHQSNAPLGSRRRSIGIDSDGSVHFDPWALLPPFSSLSVGSLKDSNLNIKNYLADPNSTLGLILESKQTNVRCRQCPNLCSGGMRLAAIIQSLAPDQWPTQITPSELITALSEIDPACPIALIQQGKR